MFPNICPVKNSGFWLSNFRNNFKLSFIYHTFTEMVSVCVCMHMWVQWVTIPLYLPWSESFSCCRIHVCTSIVLHLQASICITGMQMLNSTIAIRHCLTPTLKWHKWLQKMHSKGQSAPRFLGKVHASRFCHWFVRRCILK